MYCLGISKCARKKRFHIWVYRDKLPLVVPHSAVRFSQGCRCSFHSFGLVAETDARAVGRLCADDRS